MPSCGEFFLLFCICLRVKKKKKLLVNLIAFPHTDNNKWITTAIVTTTRTTTRAAATTAITTTITRPFTHRGLPVVCLKVLPRIYITQQNFVLYIFPLLSSSFPAFSPLLSPSFIPPLLPRSLPKLNV